MARLFFTTCGLNFTSVRSNGALSALVIDCTSAGLAALESACFDMGCVLESVRRQNQYFHTFSVHAYMKRPRSVAARCAGLRRDRKKKRIARCGETGTPPSPHSA